MATANWKDLTQQYNSSPDISPTAGQMPRLLGLAQASKVFRRNKDLHGHTHLSDLGNEVAFGTIGDASTSEGHFWETMNAAGVLQVPLAMSVWDDGWGISVSKDYQTTKGSISTLLQGFQKEEGTNGIRIYKTKAWDYAALNRVYEEAIARCREDHVPCLIHVEEVTQPQGHSTSGSHERYKSNALLDWYKEFDCVVKFRQWILNFRPGGEAIASNTDLEAIEKQAKIDVRAAQKAAWAAFCAPIKEELDEWPPRLIDALGTDERQRGIATRSAQRHGSRSQGCDQCAARNARLVHPSRAPTHGWSRRSAASIWMDQQLDLNADRYGSHLYSQSAKSSLNVPRCLCATTATNRWMAASSSATTSPRSSRRNPCCSPSARTPARSAT
jgi:2-oxoisovalerate dehydrogenase E1 component